MDAFQKFKEDKISEHFSVKMRFPETVFLNIFSQTQNGFVYGRIMVCIQTRLTKIASVKTRSVKLIKAANNTLVTKVRWILLYLLEIHTSILLEFVCLQTIERIQCLCCISMVCRSKPKLTQKDICYTNLQSKSCKILLYSVNISVIVSGSVMKFIFP